MDENRGFFPIFLDIRRKNIVMIGGGQIAGRRLAVLCDFACRPTVVAPAVGAQVQSLVDRGDALWRKEVYSPAALDGADMVLICTDDHALNHEIWASCKARGILVNNCSNHEECDFYFPGVVCREELVAAVNAGGHAHRQAAALRKDIAALLEGGYHGA